MLDIKFIRENPDKVKENMKNKYFDDEELKFVDDMLVKDKEYLALLKKVEELRASRNSLSKQVSELKKAGKDASEILKQVKEVPEKIKAIEEELSRLNDEILELQKKIPNMLHESVPLGKNDSENVEIKRIGEPKEKDFEVLSHVEIAEILGIVDFDASARVSGNGFFYLLGDLAFLNQALIQHAINFMAKKGFLFVEPPLMTREKIPAGCIDLAAFRDAVYQIKDEDLCLIATSEFPLVGMYVDQVIDEKSLPIRMVGYSQCFRKEIGAHGIDEKGLFRTHQFNKVEQVVFCKPEESYMVYDELLQNSIELFESLGLPIRIYESCSGDLGDLKAKGADLEVWSPRKKAYFEVCSVSNLTDAQTRRLNIKVFDGDKRYHPHSLNNTAIATSRAMVAILENYQNADGTITIPEVLRPYMGGRDLIESKK